jgi:hypothetical protein
MTMNKNYRWIVAFILAGLGTAVFLMAALPSEKAPQPSQPIKLLTVDEEVTALSTALIDLKAGKQVQLKDLRPAMRQVVGREYLSMSAKQTGMKDYEAEELMWQARVFIPSTQPATAPSARR